ncbi:MAG: hypothetical protein M1826_001017 [Phylliscum demangeonii]|nr:MAG: hypothetical protein M1826_001017 [Phylliscum demangeonii]
MLQEKVSGDSQVTDRPISAVLAAKEMRLLIKRVKRLREPSIRSWLQDYRKTVFALLALDAPEGPVSSKLVSNVWKIVKGRRATYASDYRVLMDFSIGLVQLNQAPERDVMALLHVGIRLLRVVIPWESRPRALSLFVRSIWRAPSPNGGPAGAPDEQHLMQSMLYVMGHAHGSEELAAPMKDVVRSLDWPQREQLLAAAILAGLDTLNRPRGQKVEGSALVPIPWVAKVLEVVPSEAAMSLIGRITRRLRERARRWEIAVEETALYRWMATVAKCSFVKRDGLKSEEWTEIEEALAIPWREERVAPYLATLGRKELGAFLVKYGISTYANLGRTELARFQADFMEATQLRPSTGDSLFNIIVALVRGNQDYARTLRRLSAILLRMRRPWDARELYRRLFKAGYSVAPSMIRALLHGMCQTNTKFAVRLFRDQQWLGPGLALADCRRFLRALIHDRSLNPSTAFLLLEKRATHPIPGFLATSGCHLPDWLKRLYPTANVPFQVTRNLLHLMVRHFARATHLAPRVAFRHVCCCFVLLRAYGHPANSDVTRAMVHTGITRPLEHGDVVGVSKVAYILHHVRSAEGGPVAHRLQEIIRVWQELGRRKRKLAATAAKTMGEARLKPQAPQAKAGRGHDGVERPDAA